MKNSTSASASTGFVALPESPNVQKNRKYDWWSFLPVVLADQFKYFLNLFYLFLTFTQFFKAFQVGTIITYVFPLAVCNGLVLLKEFVDDLKRRARDNEANNALYLRINVRKRRR